MKKLWIIIFLVFAGSAAIAQNFTFGPKIGFNNTKIGINEEFNVEGKNYTLKDVDSDGKFIYGAFVRLKVAGLYLQPEMTFNKEVTDLRIQGDNFEEVHTMTLKKWDFPLLVGLKLGPLRFNGGPVISTLKATEVDPGNSALFTSLEPAYKDTELNYQLGVGFDISRLTLDLRYEGSASDLGLNMAAAGQDYMFDHSHRGVQASIGWKIIKKSKKR